MKKERKPWYLEMKGPWEPRNHHVKKLVRGSGQALGVPADLLGSLWVPEDLLASLHSSTEISGGKSLPYPAGRGENGHFFFKYARAFFLKYAVFFRAISSSLKQSANPRHNYKIPSELTQKMRIWLSAYCSLVKLTHKIIVNLLLLVVLMWYPRIDW